MLFKCFNTLYGTFQGIWGRLHWAGYNYFAPNFCSKAVRKNVSSTDQKTQKKSGPVALCLSHLKSVISNFFVDKECAENWQNSNTIGTGFVHVVFLMDSRQLLCKFLTLLGSGLCVWLVYKLRVIFQSWFFGHKRLTYTKKL